jgi:hypothetical protein
VDSLYFNGEVGRCLREIEGKRRERVGGGEEWSEYEDL